VRQASAQRSDGAALFLGDPRGGRLLDDLLVAALHRAVALTEVNGIAVLVGEHLKLDVARVLEILLHVDDVIAEGGCGLGARQRDRVEQGGLGVYDPHAASAAAAGSLDDHRIADRAGHLQGVALVLRERAIRAGDAGYAGGTHGVDRRDLVAHQPDRIGARADEDEAAALDPLGEVGVLGEEPVAGMDRHGVGDLRGADDGGDLQVAVAGRSRADTDRFVGEQHVLEVPIGLGMHRDRLDPELPAGAQDAQRDLPAIGDQYLLDHR